MSDASATPIDRLLRMTRPMLEHTAAPAGRGVGRLRKRLARAVALTGDGWLSEQRTFEERLRAALAFAAVSMQDERTAREGGEAEARTSFARWEEELAGLRHVVGLIEERVAKLENQRRADALRRVQAAAAADRPAAAGGSIIPPLEDFDYLAFENRFRGSEELVRERQRRHAERFAGMGEVADLGCGRGEFLALLEAQGTSALGVDASGEMVALARERGLRAEHGDLFAFLADRPEGSLDGILCSHVVEHLWPADQLRLVRLCAEALRPGGVLIVETPNPKSLIAGAVNFCCDPTHVRLVFPETLAFMLESAGFSETEIEYLSPVPAERRAGPVTDAPAELAGLVAQVNEAVERLDDLVFGDQDYAVVARR